MRPSDYLHKIVTLATENSEIRLIIEKREDDFLMFRDKASALDHEHISKVCERMYGWGPNKVNYIRSQYDVFWGVCGIGLQLDIFETLDVDNYWHVHVLHTKEYREHCDAVFGYFLEHVPCL